MKFLIGGAGSIGHNHLRWHYSGGQSRWAFTGEPGFGLPVEAAAQIGLRTANGATGSVQLNYNHRPAGHQLEIVGSEGTSRWISLETGVQ
jgi:predicted dehydrogenase